jgi:hypothetical protein
MRSKHVPHYYRSRNSPPSSSASLFKRLSIEKRATKQSKTDSFVIMVQLKFLRVFKPAGLIACIFFSLFLFVLFAHLISNLT